MKFSKKNIFIGLVIFLIIAQFFPIDKTNPPIEEPLDFIKIQQAPPAIAKMLKASCYDCHSHHTVYPWYTSVAPVSWMIKSHIKNGRAKLNFSEWGNYDAKQKSQKMEKSVEVVYEIKSMPMFSYTLMHGPGKLSNDQRKELTDWFAQQK
ncbi:MAG: heme-binding domain-containing protein [Saprospiraceae bacterium]